MQPGLVDINQTQVKFCDSNNRVKQVPVHVLY